MANTKLRNYAKSRNVYFWEIARFMNVCENTITRKFRIEMSDEDSSKIRYAIDQISRQKESED